jgi:hypothetical protein
MKYEHELRLKQMEIELARINVVEHRNDHKEPGVPVKLKLQPYDHKSKDDVLTYLSEFEAIAKPHYFSILILIFMSLLSVRKLY